MASQPTPAGRRIRAASRLCALFGRNDVAGKRLVESDRIYLCVISAGPSKIRVARLAALKFARRQAPQNGLAC
jgi:hypothetical protein